MDLFQSPGMQLEDISRAHVEAYNALFNENILENIVANISPLQMGDIKMVVEEIQIYSPFLSDKDHISVDRRLLPLECRERDLTYKGKMIVKISLFHNNKCVMTENKNAGAFPIMVMSKLCHLSKTKELNKIGEDENEIGGYFVINGIDRFIRFHQIQRRNHIFAMRRGRREPFLTNQMVSMRCVGNDEVGQINTIHCCTDGNMVLKIFYRRNEYFLPLVLVLKALVNTTDEELFEVFGGNQRVLYLLKSFTEYNVFSRTECLDWIGSKFRSVFNVGDKITVAEEILRKYVAVHLSSNIDKFNFLVMAAKKLFLLGSGEIAEDDPDAPSNHELLTETQILSSLLKDRLEDFLKVFPMIYRKSTSRMNVVGRKRGVEDVENEIEDEIDIEKVKDVFKKCGVSIGPKIENFFTTGNLSLLTCSDILHLSGVSVSAERINFYRFLSHFRSISRGSFFAELKTTKVRKLRPESWGFICPVHTPDGSPCGILTHLSKGAEVITKMDEFDNDILFDLGVIPIVRGMRMKTPVVVDGKVIGSTSDPSSLVDSLREYRNRHGLRIEIVNSCGPGLFPSVLVFSSVGRLTRKVMNKRLNCEEWIGIMEQVFLNIGLEGDDSGSGDYCEVDNTNILDIVAGLTPYSDYNQSPRNMYQCQMAKQTMGFPGYNMRMRMDTKTYMLNYTQSPIVRTETYDLVKDYPMGVNCMVAVLAYTAYDMEDAVVINKGSMDRGLFSGYIYKTEKARLDKDCYFTHLPSRGEMIRGDDDMYKYMNGEGKEFTMKYHGSEGGVIDTVRVFQNESHACACITIRVIRNPTIGDKFCSRHGQKGVCSMYWPNADMPFTETGCVPDIIINPHAFPSRMTIAMLIESMSGKVGCLSGRIQDGTPFKRKTFLEGERISESEGGDGVFKDKESICDELKRYGFNYYGNEPMYSGVSGNEFRADVFMGVVFYQRLRHMVSDKFQVRTGGAVIATTRQPVGGRRKHGGVRFGEMERDTLIGHGSSYMLQDRLLKCSDSTMFGVCEDCKSILFADKYNCQCGSTSIKVVEMPYVFKYLCTELFAMNIRVTIDL